ncbi:unnamed protein product [Candidula unifasciata]|uniref:COMM domain-containing protein n=1 Tax=Candidula unifasciata TaxID=100452 RepID=A0A8S3YK41_9EUPU|nr:unnamed protein product [Candidula unifasciata]
MATDKWEAAATVLSKASATDLETVCHLVADSLCADSVLSPDKGLSIWSLEDWWTVRTVLTEVMRMVVGRGWSKEKVIKELGSLNDSLKEIIYDSVLVHQQLLRHKFIEDATAVSHAVLADFDWKLKLAMASDKLASLQEPLLQVDLDVREVSGEHKSVFLELDQSELTKLITSLEMCSKSVQQLTTNAT